MKQRIIAFVFSFQLTVDFFASSIHVLVTKCCSYLRFYPYLCPHKSICYKYEEDIYCTADSMYG